MLQTTSWHAQSVTKTHTLECGADGVHGQRIICAQGWTVMFRTSGGTTQCNLHDSANIISIKTPFGKQLPGHITTAHYTSPCCKWVLYSSWTACPSPCYWTGTWGPSCSKNVLPQHLCTVNRMLGVVLIHCHWFIHINRCVCVFMTCFTSYVTLVDPWNVGMCVCVCVCIYTCVSIYVCIYVRMHALTYVQLCSIRQLHVSFKNRPSWGHKIQCIHRNTYVCTYTNT